MNGAAISRPGAETAAPSMRPPRASAAGGPETGAQSFSESLAGAALPLALGIVAALAVGAYVVRFVLMTRPAGMPNDFLMEAWMPLNYIAHGEWVDFFIGPLLYPGSILMRAPFADVGLMLGWRWEVVYGLTMIPCLIAGPILGVWLARTSAARGSRATRFIWLWLSPFGVLLAVNPILRTALAMGHPEEFFGGVLCIAAVVQAARQRELSATLLVGLAVANKAWAIVAVPVVIALLPRLSKRALAALVGPPLLVYVPVLAVHYFVGHTIDHIGRGSAGEVAFFPPQIWWWFGHDFWPAVHAHELIPVAACMITGAWWFTRRNVRATLDLEREGLLLLALLLLLRSALDPWNNVYYGLPFLMAVYALEVNRWPVWSVVVTTAFALVFRGHGTEPAFDHHATLFAASYQVVAIPIIAVLAYRLFAPTTSWRRVRGRALAPWHAAAAAIGGRRPDLTAARRATS